MTYGKVLADLYYANPILFIAVRTLFDSCVCGAWAAFVASIGWFSRHVALNYIASYLGLLGLEFLNHYFFAAITTAPIFEFSVFSDHSKLEFRICPRTSRFPCRPCDFGARLSPAHPR